METPPQPNKKNEVEEWGGIFGITVIVTLLAAGGIYFLYTQYEKMQQNQEELQETTPAVSVSETNS